MGKPAVSVAGDKEFDPLSKQKSVEETPQNKVMSSFGISNAEGKIQTCVQNVRFKIICAYNPFHSLIMIKLFVFVYLFISSCIFFSFWN